MHNRDKQFGGVGGIKGKGVDGVQPSVHSCLSDLEKSVEEIQKESSVNHKLVTVQELEEKSAALRKLGETLTELKSESRWHIFFSFTFCTQALNRKHKLSFTLADSW